MEGLFEPRKLMEACRKYELTFFEVSSVITSYTIWSSYNFCLKSEDSYCKYKFVESPFALLIEKSCFYFLACSNVGLMAIYV